MTRIRPFASSLLVAMALALTACDVAPLKPGYSDLSTRLSGTKEVPPVGGIGYGTIEAHLNRQTNVLAWTVTYAGLSGPLTGAHFHGPALPTENAPVQVPFTGNLGSPIQGVARLTPAQAADFLAGKWYVNLHTAAHPGGEIRAQLPPRR